MKPVIKMWGLPKMTREALRDLRLALIETLSRREEAIKNYQDVIIIFSADCSEDGLGGANIHIETDSYSPILKGHLEIVTFMKIRFRKAYVQAIYRCNGKVELIST